MIRDIRSRSLAFWRCAILLGIAVVLCVRPIATEAAISATLAESRADGAIALCIGGRIIVATPIDPERNAAAATTHETVAFENCPAAGPASPFLVDAATSPAAPGPLATPRGHAPPDQPQPSAAASYRSRAPPPQEPL